MGLEAGTFISDLNSANPPGADGKSQGDDHLRLIKSVLQGTFPLAIGARKFRNDTNTSADTFSWTLYKNRIGVAADLAGSYVISGNDSVGVETIMARLQARWDDPTDGTEDTAILLKGMAAGAEVAFATLAAAGINFAYPLIGFGKHPTFQDFTATGVNTWNKPALCTAIRLEGCGGGAGSGGINGTGANTAVTAGGGSGFWGITPYIDVTAIASNNLTVGVGGLAGDFNTNGGAGGNSSITIGGLTYVFGGGTGSDFRNASGGFYSMEGGIGGVFSGTGAALGGSNQGTTGFGSTADNNITAGAGGGTPYGTPGVARHSITAAAAGGGTVGVAGFGVGAGGAFNNGVNADQNGAIGRQGFWRVHEYY